MFSKQTKGLATYRKNPQTSTSHLISSKIKWKPMLTQDKYLLFCRDLNLPGYKLEVSGRNFEVAA
jgi:hypothetical protein